MIGEPLRIYGYGLAGAVLCPASDRQQAIRAWQGLPADVDVVVLTATAAAWLGGELAGRPDVLPVTLPDPAPDPSAGVPGRALPDKAAEAVPG